MCTALAAKISGKKKEGIEIADKEKE